MTTITPDRSSRRPRRIASITRHLLAILALPFTVAVLVPGGLLRTYGGSAAWSGGAADALSRVPGVILLAAGLALFAWCVSLFARVGKGTLAPWDPTGQLVAVGPYRHVRNPMISGVLLILLGEAVLWRSGAVMAWAGVFAGINHAFFLLVEEPGLVRRFGDSYLVYRENVPRWIPRLRPWGEACIPDRTAGRPR